MGLMKGQRPAWSDRLRYFVLAIYLVALLGLIWIFRVAVAPLVIAGLIAYLLNPVVQFLEERTSLHHNRVVALVFILVIASIIALPALILPVWLDEIQSLTANFEQIIEQIGVFASQQYDFMGLTIRMADFLPDISSFSSENMADLTGDAFELLETTTRNLLWVLVILVAVYYLLRDWARMRDWMFQLPPSKYQGDFREIYDRIKTVWRGYLRGNLALMLVVGVMFTIAWAVLGVPGALVLGIVAGLLTIIPDLGPAIAAILATLVALVQGSTYIQIPNFWFGVLVFSVYLVLINIKNIWIRPRIFGRSVHMHDGIVFISIIVAVVISGILGALIVVPVLASFGVVSRYIWDRLMGETDEPESEVAAETHELEAEAESD